MNGLGAWSFGFYHYGMKVPNDRVVAGILAFKRALIDNGYGTGILTSVEGFGDAARRRTINFQTANGLAADGVIGPSTAHLLLRHYAYATEKLDGVPNHLVARMCKLESADDPVAQGFDDPSDEGWAQLHLPYFPNVSLAQAWSPQFAGQKLGLELKSFVHDVANDWDGAVAAWNVGTGTAAAWVHAGKPASGDVITLADGTKLDFYARATQYVALVKAQPA